MAAIFNNYSDRYDHQYGSLDHGIIDQLKKLKIELRELKERNEMQREQRTFTQQVNKDGYPMRLTYDEFGRIKSIVNDIPVHDCEKESHLNSFRARYIKFLERVGRLSMVEGQRICCNYHVIKRDIIK